MAFSPETFALLQGMINSESADISTLKTKVGTLEENVTTLGNTKINIPSPTKVTNASLIQNLERMYSDGTDNTLIVQTYASGTYHVYHGMVGVKSSYWNPNRFIVWTQTDNLIHLAYRYVLEDTSVEWYFVTVSELFPTIE